MGGVMKLWSYGALISDACQVYRDPNMSAPPNSPKKLLLRFLLEVSDTNVATYMSIHILLDDIVSLFSDAPAFLDFCSGVKLTQSVIISNCRQLESSGLWNYTASEAGLESSHVIKCY